jgi:hypothetical protein
MDSRAKHGCSGNSTLIMLATKQGLLQLDLTDAMYDLAGKWVRQLADRVLVLNTCELGTNRISRVQFLFPGFIGHPKMNIGGFAARSPSNCVSC